MADLLHVLSSVKAESGCYRPEAPTDVLIEDQQRLFNTHVPTRVARRRGCILPFYRFFSHLLPDRNDRLNAM